MIADSLTSAGHPPTNGNVENMVFFGLVVMDEDEVGVLVGLTDDAGFEVVGL